MFFLKNGMEEKTVKKSRQKSIYKIEELCYSIGEANSTFGSQTTLVLPAGSDWRQGPCDESFKNWWRNFIKEKIAANLYSMGKIDFIAIFPAILLNEYMRGNQFGKVVHDKASKDFLIDKLHLF